MDPGREFGLHSIPFRRSLLALPDSRVQLGHQPLNSMGILLDPQARGAVCTDANEPFSELRSAFHCACISLSSSRSAAISASDAAARAVSSSRAARS
jgi:hypothetical protein